MEVAVMEVEVAVMEVEVAVTMEEEGMGPIMVATEVATVDTAVEEAPVVGFLTPGSTPIITM